MSATRGSERRRVRAAYIRRPGGVGQWRGEGDTRALTNWTRQFRSDLIYVRVRALLERNTTEGDAGRQGAG